MLCSVVFGFTNLSVLRALQAKREPVLRGHGPFWTHFTTTLAEQDRGKSALQVTVRGKKRRERAGKRRNRRRVVCDGREVKRGHIEKKAGAWEGGASRHRLNTLHTS